MSSASIVPRPTLGTQITDMNLPLGTTPYDDRASDIPSVFPQSVPFQILDRRSHEYESNADLWANLALLYAGGWQITLHASNFLIQRHKEPQDVYQSRIQGFNYYNLLATGIGYYVSYLFRREPEIDIIDKVNRRPLIDTTNSEIRPITNGDIKLGTPTPPGRTNKLADPDLSPVSPADADNSTEGPTINTANDEAGKFYTEFRTNVDRAHTTLSEFFSRVMTQLLLNGKTYILTDLEPLKSQVSNRQQAEALGANRPYVLLYNTNDVINYRTDREGNLVWCVIKSARVDQESPFEPVAVIDQWWIYNQTSWALYEHRRPVEPGSGNSTPSSSPATAPAGVNVKTAELVASGLHALHHVGRCPIRMFHVPEGLWLGERVFLPLKTHLNEDNALGWLLRQTNLAVPVITGAGQEVGSDSDTSGIKYYSEISAISLPTNATFNWSSPPGTATQTSMDRLESLTQEIYRLMYLQDQGRPSSSVSSQRSGRAIEMDKMPSREVAETLGRSVRHMIAKMYQDIIDSRKEGDIVSVSVRGFSFLENYVGLDLSDVDRLKTLGMPSPTLMRYAYKLIARHYMQDAPTHITDIAIAEIDNYLTDETVLEFAQSTFQPIAQADEQDLLKPAPIPARVQLAESGG